MISAVPFMLVFRILHILAGTLWVGSAFLFIGFIGPSAQELGPAAGPMMNALVNQRKVAKVITGVAATTVVAGWIIWIRDMVQFASLSDWLTSRFGLVLTIGGVLATIALGEGFFGIGQKVERLVGLGGQVAASGGPPSPDQAAELERIGTEIAKAGRRDFVLLVAAVIAMATARYW